MAAGGVAPSDALTISRSHHPARHLHADRADVDGRRWYSHFHIHHRTNKAGSCRCWRVLDVAATPRPDEKKHHCDGVLLPAPLLAKTRKLSWLFGNRHATLLLRATSLRATTPSGYRCVRGGSVILCGRGDQSCSASRRQFPSLDTHRRVCQLRTTGVAIYAMTWRTGCTIGEPCDKRHAALLRGCTCTDAHVVRT